jgi:signal transduction histidine kinase
VWKSGHATCIEDVSQDDNFPRAAVAMREGLHGASGFPIVLGDETLGVLEFFCASLVRADTTVLQMFEKVGALLGQFLGRERREIERVALLSRESAARVDAENANRLKDEFLATLSHELRTPLNAVLGWTHLLSEEALDKKGVHRAIETIRRNVRLQDQIISGHPRRLSDHGGQDPARAAGRLSRRRAQDGPRFGAADRRRKKVTLAERHETTGLVVRGDPRRIEQILWNLLSNAIKYVHEEGRVEVTIRKEGDCAEIWFVDDGPGIDPAFLPHVFERFRQADSSSTRTHGGLGLGLASSAISLRCTGATWRRTTARTAKAPGSGCACPRCGRARRPPRRSRGSPRARRQPADTRSAWTACTCSSSTTISTHGSFLP